MRIKHFLTCLTVACVTNSMGQTQNSLNFDGINDFVQTSFQGVSGNSARTIEAWIKTTVSSIGNQQVITDWGTQATGSRFTFCLLSNNALRIEINGSGVSGTTALNNGAWHHVAVVYDPLAANTVKLYVDGVLDTQGSFTIPVNTGNAVNFRIGRRVDDMTHFTGSIDEIRVWNVARTQSEILSSMSNELCILSSNLIAYYTMNHGTAGSNNSGIASLTDYSAGNHLGFLQNFGLTGTQSNWVPGATLGAGFSISNNNVTACDSYFWPANGQTYTTSGSQIAVITNMAGCDSIVKLNLTISNPSDIISNVVSCDTYTWSINGQTYTNNTTEVVTLQNGFGCSYTHTLNLTINTSDSTIQNETYCNLFTWPANGQTYTNSGIYYTVLQNDSGCDSAITLNLTINYLDTSVTNNGVTLTATSSSGTYQWYDCNAQQEINGEVSQSYTPQTSGSFALIISNNNCIDTSACYYINETGITDQLLSSIQLFPNPSMGSFTIQLSDYQKTCYVEIIDVSGRKILDPIVIQNDQIITLETAGVYFVNLVSENAKAQYKVVVQF
jgi:hypothetical protein